MSLPVFYSLPFNPALFKQRLCKPTPMTHEQASVTGNHQPPISPTTGVHRLLLVTGAAVRPRAFA